MSAIPVGDPGQYQFNPDDDRKAIAGGHGEEYRALASASEEAESVLSTLDALDASGQPLDRKVRTATKTAATALRRAGFLLVLHHGEEASA